MTATIKRALADLEKDRVVIRSGCRVRDEAMSWINSPECEGFCYAVNMDYRAVRQRAVALYRRFLERAENRENPSISV
jgi:hypothetical protein